MLGGSAPSQTPGAPYNTDGSTRTTAWPSPAHQTDICNRRCGIYSLFPEPGDPPRTLFVPPPKASHHGNLTDFVKMQKVSETFFSSKFTFVSSRTPRFQSSSHPGTQSEASQLTSSSQVSKPYFSPPPGRRSKEQGPWKNAECQMSTEVVLIKNEVEEMSKAQERNKYILEGSRGIGREINEEHKKSILSTTEGESAPEDSCQDGGQILASEPDSTEFRISDGENLSEDVATAEVEISEREKITAGNFTNHNRELNSVGRPYDDEIMENNKEKCNIKIGDSGSGKKFKKSEKLFVKVESVSDACTKLVEKYTNSRCTDNNKNSSTSTSTKKLCNDSFKPSPTRTLPLSPHSGGCSRTTPVTFKNLSLHEPNPRPQNLHVEVPPLFIKKEPSDCLKSSSGTPFLSPGSLDTGFFSPGGLNVLDGQLLSPMPYSGSFESSTRPKESFLSPLDQSFFSPSHNFFSPRPGSETSFISPNIDLPRFGGYKNYSPLPVIGANYLMNGNEERASGETFMRGVPPMEGRQSEDAVLFISSGASDIDSRNKALDSTSTPCQVAEVTSASSLLSPKQSCANPLIVKQEAIVTTSGTSSAAATSAETNKETIFFTPGQSTIVSSTVGAASGRQGCQQQLNDVKIPSKSGPAPPVIHRAVQSSASVDFPSAMGAAVYPRGMLPERSANLITTWPTQTHSPTLWQYSAPVEYPPFPPVGLQLVRDPVTGHFLLIPASNLEALQRAILWPNYQSTPPQMIIPPLSVQPSSPHLLLDTNVPAVDYLTSETIHHGAPQHRILITSDDSSKRKIVNPAVVKLENPDYRNDVVVATCDNSIYTKTDVGTIGSRGESVSHPHRTSPVIESGKRSQATSPCLNPALRTLSNPSNARDAVADSSQPQKLTTVTLQDASNQTEMPFEVESEDCTSSIVLKDHFGVHGKVLEQNNAGPEVGESISSSREPLDDKLSVLREICEKNEIGQSLSIVCCNVPDSLNIKKEVVSPSQVDLSGLELLSNSIEQFVCDGKCKKDEVEVSDDERKELSNDACEGAVLLQKLKNGFREVEEKEDYEGESSKAFGGLGLLCALAEQRFREEIGKEDVEEKEVRDDGQKEKKPRDFLSEKEPEECDLKKNIQTDREEWPKLKKEVESLNFGKDERISVAEEKQVQRNLSETESSGSEFLCDRTSRKGAKKKEESTSSLFYQPQNYKEMSPPVLEKQTDFPYEGKSDIAEETSPESSKDDILKPPTLTPNAILEPTLELTPCEVNFASLKNGSGKKKEGTFAEMRKRKLPDSFSCSSSKKRKVGRPKKNHLLHRDSVTETIVAKKPKKKPPFLFRPVQKTVENWNCLKTKNDDASPGKQNVFVKVDLAKMDASDGAKEEDKKSKKIRPKLKAEPKLKEQDDENGETRKNVKKDEKQKTKVEKQIAIEEEKNSPRTCRINGPREATLPSCVLTTEHLQSDRFPVRTLTAMGGLFYAGQLSAIRPPDVYGVTIDGERGNRPHIYSREEILKDSILEIKPESSKHLIPGTRCCAYWSEQYRCLYPGTVSSPVSSEAEAEEKFVNVEFDDGDSGKIDIEDVRLLPEEYPVVEYDPNPLQSLCKRKRRISGASVESHSKERKSVDSQQSPEKKENVWEVSATGKSELVSEESERKKAAVGYEPGSFLSLESERKHLKKKRREKLKRLQSLSVEGKKKHRKHRCCDEHRHHRHHKKHRKHKHKHGKRHENEMKRETGRGEGKREERGGEPSPSKKHKSKSKAEEKRKSGKAKKCKERTESVESRSKMAAFLPARQLWGWSGKGFKRPGAKGRARKEFYKTIQRGKERITVGDCAVFLSTGRPDRPYIGRIESMWESWGTNMIVRVKWFYHPEETVGCPATLAYPGALFESPHLDENDVQTISHKCEVLPLKEYTAKLGDDPQRYETIYDNNDIYYLAGYYDPTNTTLRMEPGVN